MLRKQLIILNRTRKRAPNLSKWDRLGRVRNLQKLMLMSKANKLVAIRKVTQINQGKFSPGVDNKIVRSDRDREKFYQSLSIAKPEKTLPVKRIYIPKKKGKRPLGLPSIFDRCMQAIVKAALEPYWEAKFEPTSYGFRPGRGAHDAIERIFCIANSKNTRKWVLDADIKGAFDNTCENAKDKLTTWLAQRGLQLSEEKTQIRHLTEGFDFLGFNIRHYPVKNRKLPYIFLAKTF